jgi:biopolymer transport protein ExbD/biopolymer transport protein TolR
MAMSAGGKKGGPAADINMTPMIDILLVLLIIFMVVQQGLQKGLSVQVPPIDSEAQLAQAVDQIVLEIRSGNRYAINQQPVAEGQLQARLTEIFTGRPRKVIFVKGAEDITYGQVVYAVDAARAAGIEVVGLVPRS